MVRLKKMLLKVSFLIGFRIINCLKIFPSCQGSLDQNQKSQCTMNKLSLSFLAALNPGDIDAELSRLDLVHHIPLIHEGEPSTPQGPPRPLSPTRLQPVVAPEAQSQEIPDIEEVLRLRSEIPRPLKRRGSTDQSRSLKSASQYEPNQYKKLINKLFQRKEQRHKGEGGGERGSETSSSSEGEDNSAALPRPQPPQTSTPQDYRVRNQKPSVPSLLFVVMTEEC